MDGKDPYLLGVVTAVVAFIVYTVTSFFFEGSLNMAMALLNAVIMGVVIALFLRLKFTG
jgi:uncharacterized membrane protein (GlpM family)